MTKDHKVVCGYCGGTGIVECDCTGGVRADDDCIACGGSGQHLCPQCNARGYEWEDENGNIIYGQD